MKFKISCMLLLATLSPTSFASQLERTEVFIKDNVIYYDGTLTQQANESVFELFTRNKTTPLTLSISSDGGDVELGMALGQWVFDNKLDVEVTDFCLSSCANYVFTAGKNKYISNKAIIGFHGGLSSQFFDTSELDEMYKDLPKSQRDKELSKIRHQMNKYIHKAQKTENAFFKQIKVDQKITTLGQSNAYEHYDSVEYSGWTYHPEDYSKFGVKNVFVQNPPWQLIQLKNFGKVFIVNIDTQG